MQVVDFDQLDYGLPVRLKYSFLITWRSLFNLAIPQNPLQPCKGEKRDKKSPRRACLGDALTDALEGEGDPFA